MWSNDHQNDFEDTSPLDVVVVGNSEARSQSPGNQNSPGAPETTTTTSVTTTTITTKGNPIYLKTPTKPNQSLQSILSKSTVKKSIVSTPAHNPRKTPPKPCLDSAKMTPKHVPTTPEMPRFKPKIRRELRY